MSHDPPTYPDASAPPARPPEPPRRRGRGARLFLVITVMGLLALVAAIAGTAVLLHDRMEPDVIESSYLEVVVRPNLADAPGSEGLVLDPADFPPLLTDVTADIRRAATDDRITGLYLEVQGVGLGWAGVQELRDAVRAFRAAGKPCRAYADDYDNKGYVLAAACGEVYLAPAGAVLANGFSITSEYYAGTLEKLGVTANFEHVGEFKSGPEPLTNREPSPEANEAMESVLGGLYDEMLASIAADRGISAEQARGFIDDPPVTPALAVERGMVDGLHFRDEVQEGMCGKERTSVRKYHAPPSPFSMGERIVVLHAEGTIVGGTSGQQMFGGSIIGDRTVVEQLDDLREDEEVKAVVLRVNSPGGSGGASDNIWRAITRVQDAGTPVVVSMGDYAASGGYYIAAPADWIVAEPSTLTGSIGVFGGKLNVAGLYEKLGITTHTYQRGLVAGLFSPTSDFTDAERALFRRFLENFYDLFLDRVAAGRNMEKAAVAEVAKGRVWTGAQARERGLVDAVGGLDVAVAKARELAAVGEDVPVERVPKRQTLWDQLAEDLQDPGDAASALPEPIAHAWSRAERVARVLEGGGVAAMLPYELVTP